MLDWEQFRKGPLGIFMLRKQLVRAFVLCSLIGGAIPAYPQAAAAQATGPPATGGGTRIALISIQDAITRTREGQKRTQEIREKYQPREAGVKTKQGEIASLREQLNRGQNTMSDEAKRKLLREIQTKERELKRFAEDAESDFQQEFRKVQQDLLGKLRQVIRQYMTDNGYSLILDISNPQTPVVDASNELLITNDIIEAYDKQNPVGDAAAASSAAPASTGAATPAP